MSESNGNAYAVRVPRRWQGIPAGLPQPRRGRDPASLEAIERAAIQAVKDDPWRQWEWISFATTPLPGTTVNQKVATNPPQRPNGFRRDRHSPEDHLHHAQLATVQA